MTNELTKLLPEDKIDTGKAEALVAMGFPAVEPVLPAMLEWMQDLNWPVAQVFRPFLAGIGAPLAPLVRNVLATNDEVWKYWMLCSVIGGSLDLARVLKPELERIASAPTPGELQEGLHTIASQVLNWVRGETERSGT